MTQSLSNMKQLHLATTHNGARWYDDRRHEPRLAREIQELRLSGWATNALIDGAYLTTNDFAKLVSAPGKQNGPGAVPSDLQ